MIHCIDRIGFLNVTLHVHRSVLKMDTLVVLRASGRHWESLRPVVCVHCQRCHGEGGHSVPHHSEEAAPSSGGGHPEPPALHLFGRQRGCLPTSSGTEGPRQISAFVVCCGSFIMHFLEDGDFVFVYQSDIFPDKNHGGRAFYNEALMSAMKVPQVQLKSVYL